MVSMVTRNFGVRRCAKTKTVVGLHVLSALVTLRIYVVLNLSTVFNFPFVEAINMSKVTTACFQTKKQ